MPLLLSAAPPGRTSLGIFSGWGAFRDAAPPRCYAIATPVRPSRGEWPSFASVAIWPRQHIGGQVHFRLREPRLRNSPIRLSFGDRSFPLVAASLDAWAPGPKADAAIIAAMRSATSMRIAWVSKDGRDRSDGYLLRGIATAIDAAALGCAASHASAGGSGGSLPQTGRRGDSADHDDQIASFASGTPARRWAATSVLRSRTAIVMGPTPPGPGVIAPATSTASA